MQYLNKNYECSIGENSSIKDFFELCKEQYLFKVLKQYKQCILVAPVEEGYSIQKFFVEQGVTNTLLCCPSLDKSRSQNFGQVISLKELSNINASDCAICLVGTRKDYLIDAMKEFNIKEYYILINTFYFPDINQFARVHIEQQDKIEKVYNLWEDDFSRNRFLDLLYFRLTLNMPLSLWSRNLECYFHPVVKFQKGDIIFDGGARIGDTALKFAEFLKRDCKIYSFEPEQKNYQKMIEYIDEYELNNIIVPVQTGLWEHSGKLRLRTACDNEYSGAHQVGIDGDTDINVISLDDFIKTENIIPNVIKLDVECAEMQVVRGARELLSRYKPRLIISIYHKVEDLWEIPLYIANLHLGYKFYMVQHDPATTETILYAIAD